MLEAAIDVGTNSVLVLLAEVEGRGERKHLKVLWEDEALTRLGEGIQQAGLLKPEAVSRTAEAVRRFVEECRARGARRIVIVATSAARDAGNFSALREEIKSKTNLEVRVLSGREEAEAAFRGARAGHPSADTPCLVIDVGGGSTELTYGKSKPEFWTSLDIGSVRLSERFLHADPFSAEEWQSVRSHIREAFQRVRVQVPGIPKSVIGVGGTITTLAMLELGVDRYVPERIHGLEISHRAIEGWTEKLSKMSRAERTRLPGVPALRGDVLPVGTAIFAEALQAFGSPSLLVSTFGIRHGTLLE